MLKYIWQLYSNVNADNMSSVLNFGMKLSWYISGNPAYPMQSTCPLHGLKILIIGTVNKKELFPTTKEKLSKV